ncbi:hypothetical protein KSD_62560 [Ktedonobacter sp. SOSP1-85]|nr:hypothetical protein [Ktedonobacter sp. SOSP1-85]GHO78485.1 hypothetical protein KSD_62560 [Ktedonobacter sp. SOSP1-85]
MAALQVLKDYPGPYAFGARFDLNPDSAFWAEGLQAKYMLLSWG